MNNSISPEIRKNRMAEATVTVLKPDHTPLANQEVTIEQVRHKFLFGTAAFDLVPFSSGAFEGEKRERTQQWVENFLALCNAATLPFYWARFEPERGKPMTKGVQSAAQWCLDHHLVTKGHPLCWHTLTAPWLLDMSNPEILQAQIARIQRDVSDFRGLIDMWDVVNEAVIMPVFDKYDNGITRLCKQMGRIELLKAVFQAARETNPSATLLLNDFDVSDAFDILVEGCLEAGVRIDVIGIQSHMHQGYWGVEKTLRVLEHFERFKLPIHFTETTLVSGHLMPPEIVDLNDYKVTAEAWPTTPEGEQRQVEQAVLHYKTLFAHPLVEGIVWWDLSDARWLNAPGGLLRKDGSRKPAYDELLKLVKGEWWTGPTRLATDEKGKIKFSGFLGAYELTCAGERQAFSLTKESAAAVEVRL